MSILPILLFPDERLRQRSTEVEAVDDELRKLFDDMLETMYDAHGIGLAGPQVGVMKRVIVIHIPPERADDQELPVLKLVNPEIIERVGKTEGEEGCLSIPDVRENVQRAAEVTVRGTNENGEEVEFEATGLLAVCLQHEIDHLDGILFIDRLSRLKRELLKSRLKRLAKG
jgi:peptide deformylase